MIRITNIPDGEKISDEFLIKLNGKDAKAYTARVSKVPFNRPWPGKQRPLDQTVISSFLTFSMDEPTEVELIPAKAFSEAVIRPLSKNITAKTDGNKIVFTVSDAGQYTVELDGIERVLHIFANPIESFNISENDENVIYFGPGIHDAGLICLESNQTLYIHQDAVVYGNVLALGADNVKILGYGILDGSKIKRTDETFLVPMDLSRIHVSIPGIPDAFSKKSCLKACENPDEAPPIYKNKEQFLKFLSDEVNLAYGCIGLYKCTNSEVNGVVMRDTAGFTIIVANCNNTICDNFKMIGMWRYNSDGIDLFNSKNCIIKNSFLRNFDDCVVLKGIVGWDSWNMENISVENCVLWCDWGRSLEIGGETCAPEYKNINFRNCDCIHNADVALDIQHCDRAFIHDVSYENIRIEYSKYDIKGMLQDSDDSVFEYSHEDPYAIFIGFSKVFFSNDEIDGKVANVSYKNIQILKDDDIIPPMYMAGKSEEHNIDGVTFSNITLNGKDITNELKDMPGEFVSNVKFL